MRNLLELLGCWPGPQGLLGVDIGATAVRVIELVRRRGALACRHYGVAILPALPPGASCHAHEHVHELAALASAIAEARQASGSRACRAALAMPADSLITQTLRLPSGLPDEQLEILVELEAAQYMPFAVDDASLDFCLLGPTPPLAEAGSEVDVLLVAARRASVTQLVEVAAAAGLQAVAIDSAALARQAAIEQGGWRSMADGEAVQVAWGLALHGLTP